MRPITTISFLIVFFMMGQITPADAGENFEGYLTHLPSELKLKEEGPQRYMFTCDYFNLDTLGNLKTKQRVSGEYTRGLPDEMVKWNDVRVAIANDLEAIFPEGEKQIYMEGFTYSRSAYDKMLTPGFFEGFPDTAMDVKTLVWDTVMFEGFGWSYFDKLKLNQPYHPTELKETLPLAGSGTFQNRDIELTWSGISQRNGEPCALIQYRAFINKLTMSMPNIDLKGRSHYWGEIWVSLTDKQIEYATLYEDVLMQMKMGDQDAHQLNIFRSGRFEKLGTPSQ